MGKSSGGGGNTNSAATERYNNKLADLLTEKEGHIDTVLPEIYKGLGYKGTTTGSKTEANPEYTAIQNEIDSLEAGPPTFTSKMAITRLKDKLAKTPATVDTTKTTYSQMTVKERISPYIDRNGNLYDKETGDALFGTAKGQEFGIIPNPNYNENYAQQVKSMGETDTILGQIPTDITGIEDTIGDEKTGTGYYKDIADLQGVAAGLDLDITGIGNQITEMARIAGLSETGILKVIQDYDKYDKDTQAEILKLTNATSAQLLDINNSLTILRTARGDSEKIRQLAESTLQKALGGEVPDWYKANVQKEIVNPKMEEMSRYGATGGRKAGIEADIYNKALMDFIKMTDPIAMERYGTTSGLTKDITDTGQIALGNTYTLAQAKDAYAKSALKNRENVPALYAGLGGQYGQIGQQYTNRANVRGQKANTIGAISNVRGNIVSGKGNVVGLKTGLGGLWLKRGEDYNKYNQDIMTGLASIPGMYG